VRRSPVAGVDLLVYLRAVPLVLRNPVILVVPLLMAVIGVLVGQLMAPYGGGMLGYAAGGLGGLIQLLLMMFGVGAACIIADDAWRHGSASFDRGWEEARRRGGDILFAAIGFSLLLGVAQYVGMLFGAIAYVIMALVFYFLIWALPAAAVGGIPGGAAIQVSIDRVRSAPLVAGITAALALAVMIAVAGYVPVAVTEWLLPYVPGTPIAGALIAAVFQAIALGYIAAIITKTYTAAAFVR